MAEPCKVESCERPRSRGGPFCDYHAARILRASQAAEGTKNWIVEMEKYISEEELAAYTQVIREMVDTDAAAVQAFREPLHITREEWDARAAPGWRTTDESPGQDFAKNDEAEEGDIEENTSLRDSFESVAREIAEAEKAKGEPLTPDEIIQAILRASGRDDGE